MRHLCTTEITGLEAHLCLIAISELFDTDGLGNIMHDGYGYSIAEIQSLRDKLFEVHQHPAEDDEEE